VAKPPASDGRRDLALIRASGSTARVLNLALVFERFGQSPDFAANPLFRCQRLNRALIIKHTVRPHEAALFERAEPHTTKIVFPYSATELGLGGTSIMVGETRFDEVLRKEIGGAANEDDYLADFELLCILNDIPSFDPFLLREQLRRIGRTPARCFFEISDADVVAMLRFVADEIGPLISLAFGTSGRRAEKLAMRLAEKLMTDEDAQVLEPLRETLRLSPAGYREGVFAWKGFLYYKWLLGDLAARQEAFESKLKGCSIASPERAVRAEVERARREVLSQMGLALVRAREAIHEYDGAFSALADGRASRFRDFLLDAPAKFVALGEAMGAIKHIQLFWGFRFPPGSAPSWEGEEARELLQEFHRMLAGLELIREGNSQELMLN
jgi:hypothetical protein